MFSFYTISVLLFDTLTLPVEATKWFFNIAAIHTTFSISFVIPKYKKGPPEHFIDLIYFTTRVPDTSDTTDTSVTQTIGVRHEGEKSDISATRTTQVRHEWKILILITTQVERYFHTPIYINYIANERLLGEKQFHFKNCLFKMARSHAKMPLNSAPQKMNFVMAKAISKSFTLDSSCKWPCTFPHSYAY